MGKCKKKLPILEFKLRKNPNFAITCMGFSPQNALR